MFKVYDYNSTIQILHKAKDSSEKEKIMYVFVGPNGSGKSTYIANLYNSGILKVDYLNADLFGKLFFSGIQDESQRNEKAMFYTINKIEEYIEMGKPFCYETVLSHPSKIELIKKAKQKGYKIFSVFVYTQNPQINIDRVKKRVEQGGHNVPTEKIIKRYYRSMELSEKLKQMSDKFSYFDNSQNLNIEFLSEIK